MWLDIRIPTVVGGEQLHFQSGGSTSFGDHVGTKPIGTQLYLREFLHAWNLFEREIRREFIC